MRKTCLVAAVALLFPAVHAEPVVDRDVAVPMRDGVVLRADVFRPAETGRLPTLVYRTPYGKAGTAESYDMHLRAVERGYVVVLQDVRGRHASDGSFDPYRQEGRDGYDTIQWAAEQDWSNGEVGTFGLSYPGAVQWLAAVESPPALKAMAPAMTYASPRRFFYTNGVFDLSWLPWIYVNIAPDARERRDLPGIRSVAAARAAWPGVAEEYFGYLPLSELPYLREEAPWYFEWLAHPPETAFWDWAELEGRYADVGAAVLNLSGWHDEAYGPDGAVTNHRGLVATRGKNPRSHLVLGPWTHGVASTERREFGALDFGPDAAIDYDDLLLDFFDAYLRGENEGFREAAPVRYFVMGENAWRTADTWPPAGTRPRSWCLGTGGAGRLGDCEAAGGTQKSEFVADPARPVTDPHGSFGPRDFAMLGERDDVLVFDSGVLDETLTVAGSGQAEIFVSCDCRDLDLWVRLLDVHPDGRAISVMSPGGDVMRASYDQGGPLEPGRVYRLVIDRLLTANAFRAGHRLRVQISASFAPHLSRNLQTGESEIHSSETRPSRIRIHHSLRYPSSLTLPVLSE